MQSTHPIQSIFMKFGVLVNQHIVLTLCNHLHRGLPRNTQVNALIKYDLDQLMIKQIDLLLIHSPSHPTCNSSDQIALTWEAMQVGTATTTTTATTTSATTAATSTVITTISLLL